MERLSKAQLDEIIQSLPVRANHPYYEGQAEYSAERIRAEDAEWRKMVRGRLETMEFDINLIRDKEGLQKIKKELILTIGSIPKEKYVEELPSGLKLITKEEIEDIASIFDAWYPDTIRIGDKIRQVSRRDLPESGMYIPRPSTLWKITVLEADTQKNYIRSQLKNVVLDSDSDRRAAFLYRFKTLLYEDYIKARVAPGTSVGVIAGQSLGERITQNTLNVHKAPGVAAARQAAASFSRTQELYNVSVPSVPSSSIYFKKPQTYDTLKYMSYLIRHVTVKNVLADEYAVVYNRKLASESGSERDDKILKSLGGLGSDWHSKFDRAFPAYGERKFEIPPDFVLRLRLSPEKLYTLRVTPKYVAEAIEKNFNNIRCLFTPMGGLPIQGDVAGRTNSYPVIDIYARIAPITAKGKRKKEEVVEETTAAPQYTTTFEYQLKEVFHKIKNVYVAGVPGISQLFPYFLPLVRFFTIAEIENGVELRFDSSLMRVEGVKSSQILAYVLWRMRILGISDKTPEIKGNKIVIMGINKAQGESIKNYSAIEPLTTFARLESDVPEPSNEEKNLRKVTLSIDGNKLNMYGFTPSFNATAKLLSLVSKELQPKHVFINNNLVSFVVDQEGYEKLVKPPALATITRIINDKISHLEKEEHTLELELVPSVIKHQLSLSNVIKIAVRDSGAFSVSEKRTPNSYRLVLTLAKDGYERFIKLHDTVWNERAANKIKDSSITVQWETEILIDVSSTIPTYNQWSYQTIGSNLKEVLAIPEVNTTCTTTDDPNEVFDLFGIEATVAYLLTEINRVTNQKRDVDIRHIMTPDAMCVKGVPHSVSRHGLADQGAEALTKASMEQSTKVMLSNAYLGEVDKGKAPASCLFLGLQVNIGTKVADVKMKETFMPLGAVKREFDEKGKKIESQERKFKPGLGASMLKPGFLIRGKPAATSVSTVTAAALNPPSRPVSKIPTKSDTEKLLLD